MPDREKVIEGLKCCFENAKCDGCPYEMECRKILFKTPENQLFYAEGGNGCRLDSLGTKVFGQHLNDGEKGYYRRAEIAGVLSDEFMPEWAKAKLEAVRSVEEADATLEMGGIT